MKQLFRLSLQKLAKSSTTGLIVIALTVVISYTQGVTFDPKGDSYTPAVNWNSTGG